MTSKRRRLLFSNISPANFIKSLAGLVAYYPMDETSGTTMFNQAPSTLGSNNGTYSGVTLNGEFATFDGIVSFATIPYVPSGDITILCMLQKTGVNDALDRIIDYSAGGPNGGFDLKYESTNNSKISLSIRNLTVTEAGKTSTNEMPASTWVIPGFTYKLNEAKLYINGSQNDTTDTAVTMTIPAGQSITLMRRSASGSANFCIGRMKNLMIFNRVLTSEEIEKIAKIFKVV